MLLNRKERYRGGQNMLFSNCSKFLYSGRKKNRSCIIKKEKKEQNKTKNLKQNE